MDNIIVVPECISKQLFENALRNYFKNESIQILEFTSKAAIPTGENYTSDIFRTSITYSFGNSGKQETISVIIKCFPKNEMMRNVVQELQIFTHEANIYTNVLQKVNNLLGDLQRISAKCIYYVDGPNSVIIFEDLSVMNFKVYPRRQGLDLQHCLLVVEKLARFHATSVVLYEKDPSPIYDFTEGLFGKSDFIANWVATGFNALIEASSKWPSVAKYSAKLKAIHNQALQRTFKAKELWNFNVLNHGDCWINNFMFSYSSDGQVKDLRFVDFQLILYGSPTIDLNYFFVSSPTVEVRSQHLDTILDHYYVTLIDTLTELKYPLTSVPSRAQLREDFNSRAFYGLTGAVTVLPVVTAASRNDATLEAMIATDGNEDSFQHDSFNNERYRKQIEFLLPFYDNIGILD